MVQTLLAAFHGPVGALATDLLIYVALGLLLIWLADVATARAVMPAASRRESRGRGPRALFPPILAGVVVGIIVVQMLPDWFPGAALAALPGDTGLAPGSR